MLRFGLVQLAAVFAGFTVCGACSGGASNFDAGISGTSPVAAGDVCAPSGPGVTRGNCPPGFVCSPDLPNASGPTAFDVCRKSCLSLADCAASGESCTGPGGACACLDAAGGGSDTCTAVSASTVCHPEFLVCVTKGAGGCLPSVECAGADGLCHPLGDSVCPAPADGGLGDGGDAGADAGGCSPPDTQGGCDWPQFCGASGCSAPQNLSGGGSDSPDNAACGFTDPSGATVNFDVLRNTGGSGTAHRPYNGGQGTRAPILFALAQETGSQLDCGGKLGGPATGAGLANLCQGGGNGGGFTYCATNEAVAVFDGAVYDPNRALATAEGPALDGQFFRVAADTGNAYPLSDSTSASTVGAAITGHLIPAADWSAAGGHFRLLRCLGSSGVRSLATYPVSLHFAQAGQAMAAGNSFCAPWGP